MFILLTRFGSIRTAQDFDSGTLFAQISCAEKSAEYLLDERDKQPNSIMYLMSFPWKDYEMALLNHAAALVHVAWQRNISGISISKAKKLCDMQAEARRRLWTYKRPAWTKDRDILTTHRSFLIQFAPYHYRPLFPGTPENLQVACSREELGATTDV